MEIIRVKDYSEKVFLGIEQANIIRAKRKADNSWESYFLLGMLWTDYCRFIRIFRNYYLRLDVSLKAARRCLHHALYKSPQNPRILAAIGWTYIVHCPHPNYVKVKEFFLRAHRCAPQNSFYAWCALAVKYMLGEYEELCKESLKVVDEDSEMRFLSQITYAFAMARKGKNECAQACLANIKYDELCKLPSPEEAVWTLIEAYYCIKDMEHAMEIYEAYHAKDMMIGSPCRKYFDERICESISEYEYNRAQIFRYFNPLRMVCWWDRLVGNSMDDLSDNLLLRNNSDSQ